MARATIGRIGSLVAPARVALTAVLVLVAAACNGDDDTAPTTLAPPTTATSTTAPPTTDPPATTDDTAASTAPATAPGSTEPTVVDTTAPPPTTTDPAEEAVKQAVIDAAVESWRVFNEAKLDPFDDDKVAAMGDHLTGAVLERSIEVIGNYRFNDERSVTNPETPARIDPYPETVVVDPSEGSASVEYCRIGSNIKVQVGGGTDGSDLVIDDSINSYRERADMVIADGSWLQTGGVQIEKFEGATSCPQDE